MAAPPSSKPKNGNAMKLDLALEPQKKTRIPAQKLIDRTLTEGCPSRNADDFMFVRNIGEGSYSTVYSCTEAQSGAMFAIKILQKSHILRHEKMDAVVREKKILTYLTQTCRSHPFISQLYTSFHDKTQIFFVMNFAENGNLAESLTQYGSFDEVTTKFFGSEVLAGLQFLHDHNIIHRDMKPENVLIRANGHIVIADFGTAQVINGLVLPEDDGFTEKTLMTSRSSDSASPPPTRRALSDDEGSVEESRGRRTTFVGTALYVSPEMLVDGEVGPQTDIWGLGCILFQCLAGQAPFRAVNEYHLLKKIQDLDFSFPEGFPDSAIELIKKILVTDPRVRLTSDDLRAHPFFENVDWKNITTGTPPKLHAYLPATFGEPEFYSNVAVEPHLDERALMRLLNLGQETSSSQSSTPSNNEPQADGLAAGIAPRTESQLERLRAERMKKLEEQRITNPFHLFTNNCLILKQGFLEKKRGLFARRRMFLLTEGPHLLYIDVPNQVLKGEVPWTPCMQIELKNARTFFIHTPNRVYYLFDLENKAEEWCKAIEEVRVRYAKKIEQTYQKAMRDGTFTTIYGKKKSRKEMLSEQKKLRRKVLKEEKKALKEEKKAEKAEKAVKAAKAEKKKKAAKAAKAEEAAEAARAEKAAKAEKAGKSSPDKK